MARARLTLRVGYCHTKPGSNRVSAFFAESWSMEWARFYGIRDPDGRYLVDPRHVAVNWLAERILLAGSWTVVLSFLGRTVDRNPGIEFGW
ncbi:hypothetical protein BJY00DRAFT_111139 [Aspergillus carlsbadensis]|nr:hypothetical protein BJY00DRAFT_111139 [Aspergillus carlsbadensis]